MQTVVCGECQFVVDSLFDWKPVQFIAQSGRNMLVASHACKESGGGVEHRLQATNNCVGDAVQDGVTVVDAASDDIHVLILNETQTHCHHN